MELKVVSKNVNLTNFPLAKQTIVNEELQIDPAEFASSPWDTFANAEATHDEDTSTIDVNLDNDNGSYSDLEDVTKLFRDNLDGATDKTAEILFVANGDLMTEKPRGFLIKWDTDAYKAFPITFVKTEGVALA